jgi:hypothetical protein
MKMIASTVALIFGLCAHAAALEFAPAPIVEVGAPTFVAVSSFVYVNVTPSTHTRINGMSGILVGNYAPNAGTFHGHLSNCTSAMTLSVGQSTNTFKGHYRFAPTSTAPTEVQIAGDSCLWLISEQAIVSTEPVTVQGIRRKQ